MTQDDLAQELEALSCTDVSFVSADFGMGVQFHVGKKRLRHAVRFPLGLSALRDAALRLASSNLGKMKTA